MKMILLLGLLSPFIIHAQRVSGSWVKKVTIAEDSFHITKERQTQLSAYLSAAKKERKNILVFSSRMRNTKDQNAVFFGKLLKEDVYKVDVSMVVSKYIGETEKNLEVLFSMAAKNNWVLLFDEADELFSRSESSSKNIPALAQAKKVLTIFWCEEDCLKWLSNSTFVLVE